MFNSQGFNKLSRFDLMVMMSVKVVGAVRGGRGSFEWRIPKWKSSWEDGNDSIQSPRFEFRDATWKLEIYRSTFVKNRIYLGIIRNTWKQNKQLVSFRLSARKGDGTEYKVFDGKFRFKENDNEYESSLTEEEILNNELAPDGDLIISCVFSGIANIETQSISPEGSDMSDGKIIRRIDAFNSKRKHKSDKEEKKIRRSMPKFVKLDEGETTASTSAASKLFISDRQHKMEGVHKPATDLKNLLSTEEDNDVSIKVKDREFKVNKMILRARSSVFYSMFKHDKAEKSSRILEIVDCDPEAFQKFLQYLYTGHVEDLSNDIALKLYFVADKYDVEEIKVKCIEFMKHNLSVETFCNVVALALEHSESALLEAATEFFCKNIKEIIVTVQWQSFMKKNTVVANDLHIKALNYYIIRK